MQLVSAAAFSLMHGANDAQKTMGIIAGALFTGGFLQRDVAGKLPIPFWVDPAGATPPSASARCRAAGASSRRWDRRSPSCSRSAGSPPRPARRSRSTPRRRWATGISTTHTITGAIVGVGSTRRLSAVRWGVAGQIVWAWLLTIPASAAIGALAYGADSGRLRRLTCRRAPGRDGAAGKADARGIMTATWTSSSPKTTATSPT